MTSKHDLLALIADTGQALAHGKRLEILEMLAQHPRGVSELAGLASLKVSTASAHLQVLREAGLVTSRRAGTHVTYDLAGEDVALLLATLQDVAERHRATVRDARDDYRHEAQTVTVEELRQMQTDGGVVVLDVRPADEFDRDHLPEAVNIPVGELPQRAAEIPQDTSVVVYCRGRYCALSHDALAVLASQGRTARILPASVAEWHARTGGRVAS